MARDFSEFLKSKGVKSNTEVVSVYKMMEWVKEFKNQTVGEMFDRSSPITEPKTESKGLPEKAIEEYSIPDLNKVVKPKETQGLKPIPFTEDEKERLFEAVDSINKLLRGIL